jgi:hypothetical protein
MFILECGIGSIDPKTWKARRSNAQQADARKSAPIWISLYYEYTWKTVIFYIAW